MRVNKQLMFVSIANSLIKPKKGNAGDISTRLGVQIPPSAPNEGSIYGHCFGYSDFLQ